MINVLIAEERAAARAELQQAVERIVEALGDECVVSQTDDGLKTFRKAKRVQPDLVLLSSSLPYGGGVQLILALLHYSPNAKLIVLADRGQPADGLEPYVAAGVHGVVRRDESAQGFESALCCVLRGGKHFIGRTR